MRRGALSMFDALGFKGIWTREEVRDEPERVITKLKDLQSHAHKTRDLIRKELPEIEKQAGLRIEVETIFLSDTVVIGAWADLAPGADVTTEQRDFAAVVAVSRLTSSVLAHGALKPAPFAYRGSITFGDFALDERFIVGPAVDAAAEAMDSAEAALVWLAPSAQRVVHAAIVGPAVDEAASLMELAEGAFVWLAPSAIDAENRDHAGIGSLRHTIPLKGGARYRSSVVLPWADALLFHEKVRVARAILKTFKTKTPDLSISIKRQRTAWFLNRALKDAFERLPNKNVPFDTKPTYSQAPKLK